MNLKEISADKDIKLYNDLFDPSNPEKLYSLTLGDMYNDIILQNLLEIAEKAAEKSDGKFDVKQCFQNVKLNGKANWNPPTNKDTNGQFEQDANLSTGQLIFNFTINPILFKEQMKRLLQ